METSNKENALAKRAKQENKLVCYQQWQTTTEAMQTFETNTINKPALSFEHEGT